MSSYNMYIKQVGVTMRICTRCNNERDITEFREYKGYIEKVCKQCARDAAKAARRTIDGLVAKIYNHQKQSSKKRGHNIPSYSKEELKQFMINNRLDELYKEWVEADYDRRLTPSVDRLDDRVGYTMDNIQLITAKENSDKLSQEIGEEHNNKYTRGVVQYDLDGNKIAEFVSVAEAARSVDVADGAIIYACVGVKQNKKIYQSRGYQWRYADVATDKIEKVPTKLVNGGKVGATGVKGVTIRGDKYSVTVYHNKKKHFIGDYSTLDEASKAYSDAKLKIKG